MLYQGGTYTPGTQAGSAAISSVVTTIGTGGGGMRRPSNEDQPRRIPAGLVFILNKMHLGILRSNSQGSILRIFV